MRSVVQQEATRPLVFAPERAGLSPASSSSSPPAIVVGLGVTGLAAARALSEGGVFVHGISLSPREPGRASRRCRVIEFDHLAPGEAATCDWLLGYAEAIGDRPVLLPTNDESALWIARHRERLDGVTRVWSTAYDQVERLINKRFLYRMAAALGIRIPPTLDSSDVDRVDEWCRLNSGPYLLKPYFVDEWSTPTQWKNRMICSPEALRRFLEQIGNVSRPFLIQQVLEGGDGLVFDCYGLSDRDGRIRTMATHKRIRQYPPNFGMTSYGEIPGFPDGAAEETLFDLTQRLLSGTHYHGVFGIEWLKQSETGEYYLLDVNARLFYTIGHLRDCGVNLPLLAYRELCGDPLCDVPLRPQVRHLFWVDVVRDAGTFRELRRAGQMGWAAWISSLARCRSYAIWNVRDPWPTVRSFWQVARALRSDWQRG